MTKCDHSPAAAVTSGSTGRNVTRPGLLRSFLVAACAALLLSSCCSSLGKLVDPQRLVAPRASRYEPPAATHRVHESAAVWHDPARDRDVPVRFYVPEGVSAPPVVIFSHGIGEDRDSYRWLGEALAARGFAAVHITHAGTDKAVLRQGYLKLYRATKQPENWLNRPLDVTFVLDQLAAHANGAPAVDLSRIAAAGHSAGAFTVLALAGMNAGAPRGLRDPRVKTVVAMSTPKLDGIIPAHAYDSISIPVLHMTGTCDSSIIYRTRAKDRRVPFESTTAGRQYLITFEGVNHNTFSNAADENHAMIAAITAAWLDGQLRDDAAARSWFDDGGLPAWKTGALALEKRN